MCGCSNNKYYKPNQTKNATILQSNYTNSRLRALNSQVQAQQNPSVPTLNIQSVNPDTAGLERDKRILEQKRRQVILSKLGRR